MGHLEMEESCSHDHAENGHAVDVSDTTGSRLLITLLINLLTPAAQAAGGIYANSMALISDAVHNFSDFAALLIAYFAFVVGRKGASLSHSFGYKRGPLPARLERQLRQHRLFLPRGGDGSTREQD